MADETAGLAAQIVAKSPHTLKVGKEALYRQVEMPDEAYAYTGQVMAENSSPPTPSRASPLYRQTPADLEGVSQAMAENDPRLNPVVHCAATITSAISWRR